MIFAAARSSSALASHPVTKSHCTCSGVRMEHDSFSRCRVREPADHRTSLLELLFRHHPGFNGRSEATENVVEPMTVVANVHPAPVTHDHEQVIVAVRTGITARPR